MHFSLIQPINRKTTLWLRSIQQGFILSLPIVILGSITLSLLQIPKVLELNVPTLFELASILHKSSYGMMSLILNFAISYKLSLSYKLSRKINISPVINALISLTCFVGIILIDNHGSLEAHLGVESIAKAILCALVSTELIVLFNPKDLSKIQFLKHEIHDDIHQAIRACVPAIFVPIVILSFYEISLSDRNFLGQIIPSLIGDINSESGLTTLQSIAFLCINQSVWFFGIHPSSLIEINPEVVYSANIKASYSRHFFDTYAHIGGAGSTLGLIFCLLIASKNRHRKIGCYAILPGVFNINELLIFGLPIVFNRFLIIPFILAPIINTLLARMCLEFELITINPDMSSWNTPALISGYLSGGFPAASLQLLLIVISAGIYWPFLKAYEADLERKNTSNIKSMIKDLCNPDLNFHNMIKRQTPLADFCRQLQSDMKEQLGEQYFSMHYQAKIDSKKIITGSEALIRWKHPKFGNIPPCIFINIAETDEFINTLGEWVNHRCMKDIELMKKEGIHPRQVAINVSPVQLSKANFFDEFLRTIELYNVDYNEIELEITESQKLNLTDEIISGMSQLSDKGLTIAVDDFGMGYTSLKYLKSFNVNTIKLDGSIVKDVMSSEIIKEIIRSLSSLTKSMNGKLVAEWVEDEQQYKELISLGCNQFQGAYFSMPINRDDFISLCKEQPHSSFNGSRY